MEMNAQFQASSLICMAIYSKNQDLQKQISDKIQSTVHQLPVDQTTKSKIVEKYVINSITECMFEFQAKPLSELNGWLQKLQSGQDTGDLARYIQFNDEILDGMKDQLVILWLLKNNRPPLNCKLRKGSKKSKMATLPITKKANHRPQGGVPARRRQGQRPAHRCGIVSVCMPWSWCLSLSFTIVSSSQQGRAVL
jgi:hypothetical protein